MYYLENEVYYVKVLKDGSAHITNKRDGREYVMRNYATQEEGYINEGGNWYRNDRCHMEQYVSTFDGELIEEKDKLNYVTKYTIYDDTMFERGNFKCKIVLDGEWIRFKVFDVEGLNSLSFPPSIQSESIITTEKQGMWYRDGIKGKIFNPSIGQGVSMRWFGGLEQDNGWMCIFTKGCVNGGTLMEGKNINPVWMKTLDKWEGEKEVSYTFIEDGGYVKMAKIFREYAKENGLFKTLREKIESYSGVRKLVRGANVYLCMSWSDVPGNNLEYNEYCRGGRRFKESNEDGNTLPVIKNFSYSEVKGMMDKLDEMGHIGCVQLGGWINSGYDGRYPDIYPYNEELGSEAEFKELISAEHEYLIGIHDNYQDIYRVAPSYPKGINIKRDGRYMRGGLWGHLAYILNSKYSVEYQKRNWEKLKELNPQYIQIDTVCATNFNESYEEGCSQTKEEDYQKKQELLDFYNKQGICCGSELGMDFGIPYVAWCSSNTEHYKGLSVPLYGLVYHDCIVNGNGVYDKLDNITKDGNFPSLLKMILWGEQLHYWISTVEEWDKYLGLSDKVKYIGEWYEKIALEEMLNHRYITDDYLVEEVTFESWKVICNFSEREVIFEEKKINPYGYMIINNMIHQNQN